jgi:hypothetical protein
MKKLLIITSLFLLSFTTNPKEKKYNFELTDGQVAMLWNVLEFSKTSIQTSQSPAVDVKNAIKMIDSLQQVIKVQYVKQVDTTKK